MLGKKLYRDFDVAGKELPPIYIDVSDEELEEEAELADVDEKIKAILETDWTTLPSEQVIRIVQKVVRRLFKKGILP